MKFPNREKTNEKKKYADVVCNCSPAIDVTGAVNCESHYLIEFFSLVKMSKIYTKARTGLEQKGPNKQLLTNSRPLDEETVKPAGLACKQKSLFIAVIVPPNPVPAGVWFDFLVKVLKCTYKSPHNMHTSPELGWQASSHPCWRTLLSHKKPTPQSSAWPEFGPLSFVPVSVLPWQSWSWVCPSLEKAAMPRPFTACGVAQHTALPRPEADRHTGSKNDLQITETVQRKTKKPSYAFRLNTVSKRLLVYFSKGNMEQPERRPCPWGPGLQFYPFLWQAFPVETK